jgi:hypothetical protein
MTGDGHAAKVMGKTSLSGKLDRHQDHKYRHIQNKESGNPG